MADEDPLSIRPPPLTLHKRTGIPNPLHAFKRRSSINSSVDGFNAMPKSPVSPDGVMEELEPGSTSLRARVQARSPPPAKTCERLQVGVIGAGMAGLYATMLLKSLGIDFEVLEAAEAPGGRVRTHHFSEEEWDYVDLGAMRVPKIPIMDRVVGNVPWSLTNKLPGIKLGDYYESDGHGITMYNGFRVVGEIDWKADPFHFSTSKGGNVPDKFVHEGPDHWLTKVIQQYLDALSKNFERGFRKLMSIDSMTGRQLLLDCYKDEAVVTFIETASSNVTGYFEKAASEIVIDNLDLGPGNEDKYCLIEGGTAKLTDAMVAEIAAGHGPCVQTEHEVRRLTPSGQGVVVSGVARDDDDFSVEFSKRYTHVITTVTNQAFRLMDTTDCNLSLAKRTAQRCLTYDHSTKVALKFKTRFWERGAAPIHGGASTTDLPIRQVVYPSYGSEWDTGVLIVSYTWADDADWMGSLALSDKTRAIELCVANLAELHGVAVKSLMDELVGWTVMDWAAEKHAQGAYAMFTPGQFSSMFADLISAEVDGRLLFAGEATSVHHAWIVGSLNSAYRAVDEILCREGLVEKRIELRNLWGSCDESVAELDGSLLGPALGPR